MTTSDFASNVRCVLYGAFFALSIVCAGLTIGFSTFAFFLG